MDGGQGRSIMGREKGWFRAPKGRKGGFRLDLRKWGKTGGNEDGEIGQGQIVLELWDLYFILGIIVSPQNIRHGDGMI